MLFIYKQFLIFQKDTKIILSTIIQLMHNTILLALVKLQLHKELPYLFREKLSTEFIQGNKLPG